MQGAQGVMREVSSSEINKGVLSITIALKAPKGDLRIEKNGTGCFKLYYRDNHEGNEFRHVDDIRLCGLVSALPFFAFRKAVIKSRKMGDLVLNSPEEAKRLREWLEIPKNLNN